MVRRLYCTGGSVISEPPAMPLGAAGRTVSPPYVDVHGPNRIACLDVDFASFADDFKTLKWGYVDRWLQRCVGASDAGDVDRLAIIDGDAGKDAAALDLDRRRSTHRFSDRIESTESGTGWGEPAIDKRIGRLRWPATEQTGEEHVR